MEFMLKMTIYVFIYTHTQTQPGSKPGEKINQKAIQTTSPFQNWDAGLCFTVLRGDAFVKYSFLIKHSAVER